MRKIIKKIFFNKKKNQISLSNDFGWFDTDLSWNEVVNKFGSYSTQNILEACKSSLLKVKNFEYPYERDSVLFNKIEYSWALVSFLFMVASENDSKLRVIDFGGSLGSSYFQNREIFKFFKEVSWSVVEQEKFAECGSKLFSDDNLFFYRSITHALDNNPSKALIMSSVIQYVEDFESLINQIINFNFEWIFIDRTGFSQQDNLKRLTIQKVPKQIYEAVYPCWFFNYKKFVKLFENKYSIFGEFESFCDKNISVNGNEKIEYRGLILRKKNEL